MRNLNSERCQICTRGPLQLSFIRGDLSSSKHTTHCMTSDSKLHHFHKVSHSAPDLLWPILFHLCLYPIIMKKKLKEYLANSLSLERSGCSVLTMCSLLQVWSHSSPSSSGSEPNTFLQILPAVSSLYHYSRS